MKRVGALALGVLAGIGGFLDFGGIVTSLQAGAQFALSLVWTLVIGIIGFSVFAEMSGRITISTSRTMYEVIRDRLGSRLALIPLISTSISQLLTIFVELAGMSLVLAYLSHLSYLLFVPLAALLVASIIWFAGFDLLDNSTATLGLLMLVAIVIMARFSRNWAAIGSSLLHPSMSTAHPVPAYLFMVVSLLGAYMTPYQFAFYSSGALEEQWDASNFMTNKIVPIVGTAFGAGIALALMVDAYLFLHPLHNMVNTFASTLNW